MHQEALHTFLGLLYRQVLHGSIPGADRVPKRCQRIGHFLRDLQIVLVYKGAVGALCPAIIQHSRIFRGLELLQNAVDQPGTAGHAGVNVNSVPVGCDAVRVQILRFQIISAAEAEGDVQIFAARADVLNGDDVFSGLRLGSCLLKLSGWVELVLIQPVQQRFIFRQRLIVNRQPDIVLKNRRCEAPEVHPLRLIHGHDQRGQAFRFGLLII